MLQYPVHLQLPSQKIPANDTDYFRHNDQRLSRSRVLNDPIQPRLPKHPLRLSISTNLSPDPSDSSPSTASANSATFPYFPPPKIPPSDTPLSPTTPSRFLSPRVASSVSSHRPSALAPDHPTREPAPEFEVIKQLGSGSYAVVYLVQEVLARPVLSEDGHMSTIGPMELDNKPSYSEVVHGRKYAIKCLSKANLDEEALAIQMSEVTIHQSLGLHPNIVTLHRTLETDAYLLLLLEYVPGEDLFYFLEQARDHYDLDGPEPPTDSSVSTSHTPPTPSLLSNMHPSQLLSRTRLRLIASMFAQMCDAVAACHSQQVFHRDIKPENFIVTDGTGTASDGRLERKVIVKLTDFGLSTNDLESSDMDCGSAPYMSYECRNNVAPTYRPRAADVWSLGIVLINMLYHFNPWTDTAEGACSSFDLYRRDPVNFFMYRFTGMTKPVAEFFANKVFCILEHPHDDTARVSAAQFGAWAKNLPALLGGHRVHRTMSSSSTQGHRLSLSIPISHRPSSRPPSVCANSARTPAVVPRSLSRAPSLEPPFEREELSVVLDNEDGEDAEGMNSRSTSTNKRRKRGARKGKGVSSPTVPQDDTLITLAVASQTLAREISVASKAPSGRSASTKTSSSKTRVPFEPISMYPMPTPLLAPSHHSAAAVTPPALPTSPPPTPAMTKKPSKWKLSFGKNSGSSLGVASAAAAAAAPGRISPLEEVSPPASVDLTPAPAMSTTATNVTNLIMGLNPPPPPPPPVSNMPRSADSPTWSRGRRLHDPMPSMPIKNHSRSPGYALSTSPPSSNDHWNAYRSERAISPNSARSGRPLASSASSVVSSNWRSSMSTTSSAGTSTSAFTRYSNSSAKSISTTATSVSSASWRTSVKQPSSPLGSTNGSYSSGNLPKNIKIMDGIPWELDQLPRGQHPNPVGDIFGSPPPRKQRTRKPKDLKLDTISERPGSGPATSAKSAENLRRDASTSTTELDALPSSGKDEMDGFKKVQKGQINALAKMLSALRR